MIGATLVGITGNEKSSLAEASDIVQVLPKFNEACYLGLAPTSSTTTVLCYGDALAVVASGIYGFKDVDFGKFHPAGSLGKKLILKVNDLMTKGERNAKILIHDVLKNAIVEMNKKELGFVSIVDVDDNLLGIITDGDLRRQLEKGADIYSTKVDDVMTTCPIKIESGKLAVEALNMLKDHNIGCLPVIDGTKVIGAIRFQDIVSVGIVL